VTDIDKPTGILLAVQILLGHATIKKTLQ